MNTETQDKLKRMAAVSAPSLFTVGNMACGFFAILAANSGQFSTAGWLILTGIVLDGLDGRIARLVHGESAFGVEFDSLSDFVTFCVAPGCVMYAFVLKDYGMWGQPVAFVYALCGGLRLARFNVAAQAHTGSKTHFVGLPTPAAAGILASFLLLYDILETDRPARTLKPLMDSVPFLYPLIPFVMLALAILMVSRVPYAAFKQPNMLRPRSARIMLLAVALLVLVFMYPQNAIFLFFAFYVISGLAAVLWRTFVGLTRKS